MLLESGLELVINVYSVDLGWRVLGLNELIERVRDTITDLENELEEVVN